MKFIDKISKHFKDWWGKMGIWSDIQNGKFSRWLLPTEKRKGKKEQTLTKVKFPPTICSLAQMSITWITILPTQFQCYQMTNTHLRNYAKHVNWPTSENKRNGPYAISNNTNKHELNSQKHDQKEKKYELANNWKASKM